MIQLLFEVGENYFQYHWCTEYILCMFSPHMYSPEPSGSFLPNTWVQEYVPVPCTDNQVMDSCLVVHWRHTALCTAQSSVRSSKKKWMKITYLSSDVERLKKKLIQTFRFDSPPPRTSAFTSESHFPTPYTMQFERISRLFNMLLFFPSFLTNSSAYADTSSACWVPLPSLPQFQRKSCKGRTEPPWNINIRNAVIKSRLFSCVPGSFLFRAFRSNPLWIWDPWMCLNIPPQSNTGFSSPGKNLIWEFTELE